MRSIRTKSLLEVPAASLSPSQAGWAHPAGNKNLLWEAFHEGSGSWLDVRMKMGAEAHSKKYFQSSPEISWIFRPGFPIRPSKTALRLAAPIRLSRRFPHTGWSLHTGCTPSLVEGGEVWCAGRKYRGAFAKA